MVQSVFRLITLFFLFILSFNIYPQYREAPNDQSLAKYEIGLGFVYALFPHYPSADQSKSLAIPLPTFIYRGDIVRADEDGGLRGRFFNNDFMEVNLSIGGSLPADSENNDARTGMPDLKTIIELGPGIVFHLIPHKKEQILSLSLNIPLRIPFAVDFNHLDDRGIVINPLLYSIIQIVPEKWQLFSFLSYRYGDKEFQETFFEVSERYTTQKRPGFTAKKGTVLFGYGLGLGYRPNNRWQYFAGLSVSNLKDNPNKDSPLFRKDQNISLGLGIVWWFYQSKQRQSLDRGHKP